MEDLGEQLKTLHNLIEIAQVLVNVNQQHLLPTILEVILLETQTIVLENCIKEVDADD